MPNLNVIRPADYNETLVGWKVAVESKDRPTLLVLTRQNVPVLEHSAERAEEGVRRGAYIASPAQSGHGEGILIAAGSEVALAIEAQAKLREEGIDVSVVSMPAENRFAEQDAAYQESILPSDVTRRVAIEMGATYGWHKYTGLNGAVIGIDRFGASGKGEEVVEHFGFTADNIVSTYKKLK